MLGVPFLIEPRVGVGFRDDREDLDLRFCNVIEHPDVAHAEAVHAPPRLAAPINRGSDGPERLSSRTRTG